MVEPLPTARGRREYGGSVVSGAASGGRDSLAAWLPLPVPPGQTRSENEGPNKCSITSRLLEQPQLPEGGGGGGGCTTGAKCGKAGVLLSTATEPEHRTPSREQGKFTAFSQLNPYAVTETESAVVIYTKCSL